MMTTTVRSAVVAAMIGAATLTSVGLAQAAPSAAPGRPRDMNRVFPGSGPQERMVVDYLTAVMRDFDAVAGPANVFAEPTPRSALQATTTTYASGAPRHGTQTVVVEVHRNIAGARPSTWFKTFSYDTAARVPITIGTLFRPGTAPLRVIAPIVARDMDAQAGRPVAIDPSVALSPATYQNFALTDDAVVFFFDEHQLHQGHGATEVSVPRTALAGLLRAGL